MPAPFVDLLLEMNLMCVVDQAIRRKFDSFDSFCVFVFNLRDTFGLNGERKLNLISDQVCFVELNLFECCMKHSLKFVL